jgi:hypothetical protein
LFEAQRWLAHFTDTFSQFCDVFRAVMGVEAESGFEFVDGLGCDPSDKNLAEPLQAVVIAFQSRDALLDGKARPGGILNGTEPCE